MAAKKAAKKVAKKAAKKSARHGDKHHGEGKDLRRAFEHLGRLTVLESQLDEGISTRIRTLTEMARHAVVVEDPKIAADLLRASEHLAFASLVTTTGKSHLSEPLQEAIHAEYDHLLSKAVERWEEHKHKRPARLVPLYVECLERAASAAGEDAFGSALEYVRAAEALTHIHGIDDWALPEGKLKGKKDKKALKS